MYHFNFISIVLQCVNKVTNVIYVADQYDLIVSLNSIAIQCHVNNIQHTENIVNPIKSLI